MRRPGWFIVALVVALYAPFLLGGRVFIPADILQFVYPWKTGTPQVRNLETVDVLGYFYPQDAFLNERLKVGDLPLWNPHIFSGHPLVANGSSALFYPGRLLLHRLLPPGQARTLSLLLHQLALGLGMFLFLRARGLDPIPATLGGVVWMLNAFMASWLEFEHVLIIGSYVPIMLLGVEKGLATGRRAWWCLVALAGGLSLSGGHVQFCLYTGPLVAAYGLIRAEGNWRRLLPIVPAGLLAIMLAAPTLLPFLELQSLAQRAPLRLEDNAASLASYLPTLLCPDFWGNPARGLMLNRCPANLVFPEFACYFGVIPLLLALAAPIGRETRFWIAVLVLSLWAASATFPYPQIAGAIPFLSKLIPGRILILTVLAGSILAAFGAQRVQQEWPPWLTRVALALAVGWALLLLWVSLAPPVEWAIPRLKIPPRDLPDLAAQVRDRILANTLRNPQFYMPILAGVAFWVAARRRSLTVLLLVAGLDLWIFAQVFNPTARPEDATPRSEALARIQGLPGRVDKFRAAFYNTMVPYGFQLTSGYESLFPARYYRAISLAEPGVALPMRSLSLERFDHKILDALNLRFLVTIPEGPLPPLPGWKPIFTGDARVFENTQLLPRAWIVGQAVPCGNLEQALKFVDDPRWNPLEVACVEGGPVEVFPRAAKGTLDIRRYLPDRVVIDATLPATGLLVLADQWYPGWVATVDGQPTAVLPTNAIMRGVVVPMGKHRVVFEFRPEPLKRGTWLAGIALAVLALGLLPRGLPSGGKRT